MPGNSCSFYLALAVQSSGEMPCKNYVCVSTASYQLLFAACGSDAADARALASFTISRDSACTLLIPECAGLCGNGHEHANDIEFSREGVCQPVNAE